MLSFTNVILIVSGVSGSGKTTVGALLAGRLGWSFEDGDDFHTEASVAKMQAGVPLTDTDRMPWLHAIAAWMDEVIAAGESAVLACSALKRSYRAILLDGRRDSVFEAFLDVPREELVRRLTSRAGHFFPEELLDSQLSALERPGPDEAVTVTVIADVDSTATAVLDALKASGRSIES